ncbi:MAG: phosphoribosylglycinamide formyltransferase [Phycisphaerae bacterium]|nr:phosphoribosylglycinamide formyltransferase [Phycisphaerae bacterium]
MAKRLRLGVLLSGSGRTLENILKQIQGGSLKGLPCSRESLSLQGLAEVAVVIASRPGIRGIEIAQAAGVPTRVIRRKEFASTETYSDAMVKVLDEAKVDLVCLAGFLSYWIIPDRYLGRVINIHPALLPAFGGKGMYGHHIHEAVLARGCKVSGCTVHFVNNTYDDGPIVLQRAVPVSAEDTPDTLAARVFEQECIAYPEAIRLFAEGRLRIARLRQGYGGQEGCIVHILPAGKATKRASQ